MIGVFGDSYADLNPRQYIDESLDRLPWPMWLEKFTDEKVECHGVSATSIWYSYKKFISSYRKYDTVIFCYSDLHRWYNINDGEICSGLYHIRYKDQLKLVSPEFLNDAKVLVDSYELLHDWELDKFLFQSIFNSVNALCDKSRIKVINILNFEEINRTPLSINITTTTNTVLTNLVQVSGNEYLHQDGSAKYKDITKLINSGADKRFCHLNPHNNKILAGIITECLENDVGYINLGNHNKFSYTYEDIKYLLELD